MALDEQARRMILMDYEKKRDKAERDAEYRKKDLYLKIPELESIDSEISKVGMKISRAVLFQKMSKEDAAKLCEESMGKLRGRKEQIYRENNIPSDYLEKKYQCGKCKDQAVLPNGEKCSCYTQQIIGQIQGMSNMENLLEFQNFQTFDDKIFDDKIDDSGQSHLARIKRNVKISREFIENFTTPSQKSLMFLGPTGTGKTFLSSCIAKEIIDSGETVVYKTSQDLIKLAKNANYKWNDDESSNIYEVVLGCDLLIIDDLGTEIEGKMSTSEIFNIINSRIVSGKKMIISTNLGLKEIEQRYTERVYSRIVENFTCLGFKGNDLRVGAYCATQKK